MSKDKYIVMFGWEVEASSIDKARMIAKRNLKTKDNREYIADWENRTTIAWQFHNMYPEINIDLILDGLQEESDVIHGVSKITPEEKQEVIEEIIEVIEEEKVEELSEKEKQIVLLKEQLALLEEKKAD